MRTYQVTIKGYKGDTDETDDKVIWINAPSRIKLISLLDRLGAVYTELTVLSLEVPFNTDEGIDFIIPY